jgi:phosphoribosylanthranilate isomerase
VIRAERTRIKICGITAPDMARDAALAGADAIGIVFAAGSARHVDVKVAREIAAAVPPFVEIIAVFSGERGEPEPVSTSRAIGARWVQLHGDHDEGVVEAIGHEVRLARGFLFEPEAVARWDASSGVAALVVDGSAGGGGTSFDHAALASMMQSIRKPVVLAGGLTPANVADAIRTVHPWGVDVSSGVESAPGLKDRDRIRHFVEMVRAADAEILAAAAPRGPRR